MPVTVPQGVDVSIKADQISVKGAGGTLSVAANSLVTVQQDAGKLTFVVAPAEPSAEALQQALGDERIIVTFANPQEPMQVNLRERGLTAARAA
jgi:ribosomal protein L6P/L9E